MPESERTIFEAKKTDQPQPDDIPKHITAMHQPNQPLDPTARTNRGKFAALEKYTREYPAITSIASGLLLIASMFGANTTYSAIQHTLDQHRPAPTGTPSTPDMNKPKIYYLPIPSTIPTPEKNPFLQPLTQEQIQERNDIIIYMREKKFSDNFDIIQLPEEIIMHVETTDGINRRDLPDPVIGREILTEGPGTGPTYKRWYTGIDTTARTFLIVTNPRTNRQSLWAVQWSSTGGFPDGPQPHLETFAVYYDDQSYMSFKNKVIGKNGEITYESIDPVTIFPQARQLFSNNK